MSLGEIRPMVPIRKQGSVVKTFERKPEPVSSRRYGLDKSWFASVVIQHAAQERNSSR
jgi:hypothetical protein